MIPSNDPWKIANLKELRHNFHKALLDFLSLPTEQSQITQAFLWSSGSWDPQGIDRASTAMAISST